MQSTPPSGNGGGPPKTRDGFISTTIERNYSGLNRIALQIFNRDGPKRSEFSEKEQQEAFAYFATDEFMDPLEYNAWAAFIGLPDTFNSLDDNQDGMLNFKEFRDQSRRLKLEEQDPSRANFIATKILTEPVFVAVETLPEATKNLYKAGVKKRKEVAEKDAELGDANTRGTVLYDLAQAQKARATLTAKSQDTSGIDKLIGELEQKRDKLIEAKDKLATESDKKFSEFETAKAQSVKTKVQTLKTGIVAPAKTLALIEADKQIKEAKEELEKAKRSLGKASKPATIAREQVHVNALTEKVKLLEAEKERINCS